MKTLTMLKTTLTTQTIRKAVIGATVALAALGASSAADASGRWSLSLGFNAYPAYPAYAGYPGYYYPPQVYEPPGYYYAPAPRVFYEPLPAYYGPRVVYAPAPVYYGRGRFYDRGGRGHWHDGRR